jgi:hypothetical protein
VTPEAGKMAQLPNILRILVIDDRVGAEARHRRLVRNHLFFLGRRADPRIDYVDVVFAKDPMAGATLWMQETFDLTLIDCDFATDSRSDVGRPLDLQQRAFALHANHLGLMLYDVLSKMTLPEENFAYRTGRSELRIWTSLSVESIRRYLPGVQLGDTKIDLKDRSIIPKGSGTDSNVARTGYETLGKVIAACAGRVVGNTGQHDSEKGKGNPGYLAEEFKFRVERVLTLARLAQHEHHGEEGEQISFSAWGHTGGYLICDRGMHAADHTEKGSAEEYQFPYFPELCSSVTNRCLRFAARLPHSLLEEGQEVDNGKATGAGVVRWLPINQATFAQPIYRLVNWLCDDSVTSKVKYSPPPAQCRQLKRAECHGTCCGAGG